MTFTLQLPHDMDSIPAARRAVDRVGDDVDETTLRNARLLVSELVTNVIRHVPKAPGDDQIALTVESADGRVRIDVCDRGTGFVPAPRVDHQDSGSGWGLHILAQVAARWGVESGDGTRVWFELHSPTAAKGPSSPHATAA